MESEMAKKKLMETDWRHKGASMEPSVKSESGSF